MSQSGFKSAYYIQRKLHTSIKCTTSSENTKNCIPQRGSDPKTWCGPQPEVGPNWKVLLYLREYRSLQPPRAKETSWSDLDCFIRYLFASQMLANDFAWPLSFTQTSLLHCLFFLHLLHPFLFWSFPRLFLEGIHLDLRPLLFVGYLTGIRTF